MKSIKKAFGKTQTYIFVILIIYCVIVSVSNSAFLTVENLFDVIHTSAVTMILALGVLLVLTSGGIDISFTTIAVFGAYTAARIIQETGIDNLLFAFAIAIAIGAILGSINAIVIHKFKLPTLIATLGTQSVFLGLMAILVGTTSINTAECPECFKAFGGAKLITVTNEANQTYGLSTFIIPVLILIVLTWFIMYKTRIGRGIFAIGNSEVSAIRAGFDLFKIRMFLYMYVGVLSAIAGILLISEVAWITPISNYMIGSEITVIAAVVIGGTKLSGGQGTVFGTIIGVLLIRLFSTTLIFLGLSTNWNNFFTGIVLLGCLVGTALQTRIKRRSMLLFED